MHLCPFILHLPSSRYPFLFPYQQYQKFLGQTHLMLSKFWNSFIFNIILPSVCSQSNIIILRSYFDRGLPWSFAISFGDTMATRFIFASKISCLFSGPKIHFPTLSCQLSCDSLYGTGGRRLCAWFAVICDKKALKILGVSGLLYRSLNLDQVKSWLAQLLQSFIRYLKTIISGLTIISTPYHQFKQNLGRKKVHSWFIWCLCSLFNVLHNVGSMQKYTQVWLESSTCWKFSN